MKRMLYKIFCNSVGIVGLIVLFIVALAIGQGTIEPMGTFLGTVFGGAFVVFGFEKCE